MTTEEIANLKIKCLEIALQLRTQTDDDVLAKAKELFEWAIKGLAAWLTYFCNTRFRHLHFSKCLSNKIEVLKCAEVISSAY